MGVRFEISWTATGGRQFQLKNDSGEVILQSESYKTLSGCTNGIASCQDHAPYERFYVRNKEGTSVGFYLRAANNRILGCGPCRNAAELSEADIAAIKKYAPGAEIRDKTR
ncbi:YegP family protein [Pseudomonas citronellolis]|uniref:YegP family protein n=1 Tax=Pseudomonas citronellolis TaxID=53408 RepID=UPI0036F3C1B5